MSESLKQTERQKRSSQERLHNIPHIAHTHMPACASMGTSVCVCVCAFVSKKKNIQNLIIALIFNLVAIQKGAVSRLEIHQIRLHLEYDPTHSVVLYMCSVCTFVYTHV